MKKTVEEICDIRFGLYTQFDDTGDIPYLQVRQFNEQGLLTDRANAYVMLNNISEQYLLKDGDVLFVGKGNRLFAWCYSQEAGPFVASSIFFILRPKQEQILPEYLTAVLNASQSMLYFHQIGSGTNIFSIRKSELGALEIPLPTMDKQKKIAAIAELHQKEIELMQDLIMQKQNLFNGIISKLLK